MRGHREAQMVAALDVGSSKVVAAVAVPEENRLRVLGVGQSPAAGVRRGAVVDIAGVAAAMSAAVSRARRVTGRSVPAVTLGSAGGVIFSCLQEAQIDLAGPREVEAEHVSRLLDDARRVDMPAGYQVVHAIPVDFRVDGYEGCRQPVGMTAAHLEVSAHVVACQEAVLSNLWKAADLAGVQVEDFVLSGLAASEAVLSDQERQVGVVVADMGAESTQVTVYAEGEPTASWVFPLGGAHVTRDIGTMWGVGPDAAEQIKLRQGSADEAAASDRPLEWPAGVSPRTDGDAALTEQDLSRVVAARVEDIVDRIAESLEASGLLGRVPGGLVCTGGGSRLRGLSSLCLRRLGLRVRCGGALGAPGNLGEPALAAAVGLLQFAARRQTGGRRVPPLVAVRRGALVRWWDRVSAG